MTLQDGPTQSDRMVKLFSWTFPSVCVLCVANVLFRDSILFLLRVVGNRVPSLAQRGLRLFHAVFNLAVAVAGYFVIHGACRPAVDVCSANVLMQTDCTKVVSLALCGLFALSLADRFVDLLLYPAHTSSFLTRMGEAGGIVIGWQLIGDKEGLGPLFVSLLLARRSRFAFPRTAKYGCIVLRCAIGTIAFNALGKNCNTVSQKASVGILLSTVLLSSATPCSTPSNGSGPLAAAPKAPAMRTGRRVARTQSRRLVLTASPSFLEPTSRNTRKLSFQTSSNGAIDHDER